MNHGRKPQEAGAYLPPVSIFQAGRICKVPGVSALAKTRLEAKTRGRRPNKLSQSLQNTNQVNALYLLPVHACAGMRFESTRACLLNNLKVSQRNCFSFFLLFQLLLIPHPLRGATCRRVKRAD